MTGGNARRHCEAVLELLVLAPAVARLFPLHVGRGEPAIRQILPRWLMRVFSRYEHLAMRTIDFLADREWIYSNDFARSQVMRVGELVMKTINGEVLTLGEAREMVASALVAADSRLGFEECGACLGRCPFDARVTAGPVGATRLERKKGARLIYARRLVS